MPPPNINASEIARDKVLFCMSSPKVLIQPSNYRSPVLRVVIAGNDVARACTRSRRAAILVLDYERNSLADDSYRRQ
jgi:hypothetical protein